MLGIVHGHECGAEGLLTSGGTEASNLFLKGRTFQLQSRGVSQPVWLATRAEHHATLDALQWLEGEVLEQENHYNYILF